MDNDAINNLTSEQIKAIIEENQKFKKEIAALKQKNTKKDKKIVAKDEIIKKQKDDLDKIEAELRDTRRKLEKALKKIENKTHIIKLANHNKFYSTSENSKEPIIIDEAEATVKKKRGRPKGSKNFENLDFEKLASEVIVNDSPITCVKCGSTMNKIREDVSYKLEVKPAEYKVVKIITPIYACKNCGTLVEAPSPSVFNHSVCTPSLAANIINAKYDLGVPIYRYSKFLKNRDMNLSPSDLSHYILAADVLLQPLYNYLYKSLIHCSSKVINIDETKLEVLEYKNEDRKNGFVFAYITSYYDNPIYVYSFNKTRETDEPQEILKRFRGYVVVDGYSGYNILASKKIKIQRCWTHIRRYFFDIVKTTPKKLKNSSVANQMVIKIDKLFHAESKFIEDKLGPKKIKEKRKSEEYQAILNDIYDYLHTINAEEGTPLYKAIEYFKNMENESKTFLSNGHIPISNNIAERAIKPFTILRRNFLFAKTEKGAKASARLFSIVQTAKANGLVPEYYIKYVLESINKKKIDDLLPWSKELPSELKAK